MGNALDKLEESTATPSGGGGNSYADWWSPHRDDPEQLTGIVFEAHDTKFNEEDDPSPVIGVRSVGAGGYDKGEERSTRTHVQIVQGIEENDVQLGDLVNIKYDGLKMLGDSGNATNTYKFGHVPQSEWKEMDDADDLHEVLEMGSGLQTDERGDGASATNETPSSNSAIDASDPGDTADSAEDFIEDLLQMQNGSMEYEKIDKMVNEVRDMGVDLEEKLDDMGYEIDEDNVVHN